MEKTTSSALKSRVGVKAALLLNFTPLRRWKVYSVPSSEMSHFSAKAGTTSVVPGLNSTRRLNNCRTTSIVLPPSKKLGLKPSGLASEQ